MSESQMPSHEASDSNQQAGSLTLPGVNNDWLLTGFLVWFLLFGAIVILFILLAA